MHNNALKQIHLPHRFHNWLHAYLYRKSWCSRRYWPQNQFSAKAFDIHGQNIQMRKICLLHTSVAGDNILANKQYIATHFEFYVLTNAPESNHRAPWGEKVLQYNWRIRLWIMKGFQLRWDNINIIFPNTTNPFQHSATSTPPNIIFLILIATGQTRTGNEQMKLTHMSTINVTLIDKLLQVDAPGWS
jgi:hypothetical protein